MPNRSESPMTCGHSMADVPHLRADAPVHKLYQDSIHMQATQGRRRSHTSTRLDVSKQDGCTIYMQEGTRQAKPLACICITYRLDELATCRYLHAPKTTTTMQEDNHVYKQIDRQSAPIESRPSDSASADSNFARRVKLSNKPSH